MYVEINCVIIDADATNRQEMATFLSEHGVTVVASMPSLDALPGMLRRPEAPKLVMVNLDPTAMESLKIVGPLIRQFPDVNFFVMSSQSVDAQLLMEAMHYGVKEFVPLPVNPERLVAGIERISGTIGGTKKAKIIHVIPSIGGCGSTSIACNVAVSLARGAKTVLLDLDLVQGSVATSFDLNPKYTIADVMSTGETLDKHLIDNAMAIHSGSGLCVLARPEQPEDSLRVNRQGFNRLLGVLVRQFDYVVLDSAMSVEPLYAGAIQAADVNLLVIQLNVPSVRNAERFISAMKRMAVDSASFKLVVNRFEKRASDITPDDAAKALGLPISWMIPNDFRSAIAAINFGQPLVLRSPKAEISASYGRLVQMLNGHVGKEND